MSNTATALSQLANPSGSFFLPEKDKYHVFNNKLHIYYVLI